jgi:hypothetical protein
MVSLRVSSVRSVSRPGPHLVSSKQCGSPRWQRPCRWSVRRRNEAISLDNIYIYTREMGTRKLGDQEGEAKPLCVKACCVHKFLCVKVFLYI